MKNVENEVEQISIRNIVDGNWGKSREISIFDTVWPIIEKKLSEERTVEWLCDNLVIRKVQLDDCLKQGRN